MSYFDDDPDMILDREDDPILLCRHCAGIAGYVLDKGTLTECEGVCDMCSQATIVDEYYDEDI